MPHLVEIDLAEARHPEVARQEQFRSHLRKGLTETGFVVLAGHGIPSDLVRKAHSLFEIFFDQPAGEKARAGGVPGGQRGFTPIGVETARESITPDLKEFFHVGQETRTVASAQPPYPANVWPTQPAGLKTVALHLYRALEDVAVVLLEEIALAFGLPRATLSTMIVEGNSILRAVHYPPVPKTAHPLAMRAAPHEDINLITLLCAASDDGLEICLRDGVWTAAESKPGTLVADVGDMLARVTNGKLPATTHRVVARGESANRSRYALPFFAHPRPECDLSVLPAFVPPDEKPQFPPTTAARFLEERLREIGLLAE
ncbi:MAG: hypothetical protein CBC48_18730 [bacterium TMED88]|nr:2OG-Fe(II) oxygenase [Deltaproteobacteria bacterium]OUV23482.1 MAG: hypothetical protein CBC48_18730 [bacterium TMED88]